MEQRKLIENKGVAVDKVLSVFEVAVALRAVGKIKQGFNRLLAKLKHPTPDQH
ncbi:hypothetical protein [Thiomicrospira microaerophila]|uniref:hypothetical protein n=1 Tax=Thiomicrospira microaerophila TaxID=406020 RepID=UPI001E33AAF5|nr:hypothetical protein [Thiomicrospira microaerophila]